MKKERIEYLDILRAIGILYMIFGHITLYPKYDHYIHAFHMPLFFFITGYFFAKNEKLSWKEFVKKISKKILIPYFILGITFALTDSIFFTGIKTIPKNLLTLITINNENFPIAGAFWYFTCLYFAMILFYFLRKLIKKDYLLIVCSFLIMLIGIYFKKIINIELWLSIIPSFVAVEFIDIGYFVNKNKMLDKYQINNIFILMIIFIINYILIFKTSYVNMRTNTYPNIIIFLLNFIMSMIFYLNISRKLDNIKCFNSIAKRLKFIGKYSIVFLELNQFIILILKKILIKLPLFEIGTISYSIFIFILTVIIIYVFTNKIINSKIKILFGL